MEGARGRSRNTNRSGINNVSNNVRELTELYKRNSSNNARNIQLANMRSMQMRKSQLNQLKNNSRSQIIPQNQANQQSQQLQSLIQQAAQSQLQFEQQQQQQEEQDIDNLPAIPLNVSNIVQYDDILPDPNFQNPFNADEGQYAIAGKYSTDIYGIRKDTEAYKQAKQQKMYTKASIKGPIVDFQTAMLARVANVDRYSGTADTFGKFANISYNNSGQILYNNSLIGWKNLVKALNLSKYETRGPVVIFFKRLAQMARATTQLANYIAKGKNIQQAIDRETDPRVLLTKKYAALKKYYINMDKDPKRRTDYDYKMRNIMEVNAAKRDNAINANYDDVIDHQTKIYDMVMQRRNEIRQAYAAPMRYN